MIIARALFSKRTNTARVVFKKEAYFVENAFHQHLL